MISYAQNFEDVILTRALRDVAAGTYVDIGANHPDRDSVSKAFYLGGWRGVHVEPVPAFAEALRKARPDETVIEAAVGTQAGPIEIFDVADTGLSTADPGFAARHKAAGFTVAPIRVPTVRLSDILTQLAGGPIHWLKIDVEGMEQDVLDSWGKAPQRPWIVVVEATEPNSPVASHAAWEGELTRRDYVFQYFDGLNRFYLHRDEIDRSRFFGAGPNPFDDFTLAPTSPYVGLVKDAANARYAALHADLERATRDAIVRETALKSPADDAQGDFSQDRAGRVAAQDATAARTLRRERELLGQIAQANAERADAQARLSATERELAALKHMLLRRRHGWLLRENGKPRSLVRRLLFHASGKPRGLTRSLVIRANGMPRAAFMPWMTSPAYMSLRRPYRVPHAPQRPARDRGAAARLLLRRSGKPRSLVRRALFHAGGRPRAMFRGLVLQPDGVPRPLFRRWMDSPRYLSLPAAHDYGRYHDPNASPVGPAWLGFVDKDNLDEADLSALMDRIRAELQSETA